MSSRQVSVVNDDIRVMFERMAPRHIALLVAKILRPDIPLIELTRELWPDLKHQTRKELMNDAQITSVMKIIQREPWLLTKIMAGKLAPVAFATLFELSQNADKDNVRATAAKELIRLAQSTASSILVDDSEPATDALDRTLAEVEEEAFEMGEDAADEATPTIEAFSES